MHVKRTRSLFKMLTYETRRATLKPRRERLRDWLTLMIVFNRNNWTTCSILLLKAIFQCAFQTHSQCI